MLSTWQDLRYVFHGLRAAPGLAVLAAGIILQAAWAFGQAVPAPAFEVASIKPSQDPPGASSGITTTKGRISARNVTLKRCMRGAYAVEEPRILGGPKWLDDARYNIEAKAAGPAGDSDLARMLQSLLAERFKLAFHRERRALSGYALVLGKGGLKAKTSDPDAGSRTSSRWGSIEAAGCDMAHMALKLSEVLHLPVADFTALPGEFDFKLGWTADNMRATPPSTASPDAASGTSIFEALEEQLGLKLESRKVPAEVLVIDHAEKPSEN